AQRATHFERAYAQHALLAATGDVGFEPAFGLRVTALPECDANLVRACGRGEPNVLQAFVDRIDGRVLPLVDGLHVGFAADRGLVDLAAIERHDDLVLELHVVDPDRLRHVGDVDDVLAVGRELMLDDDAATR